MGDISNKSLATLIVVALVVSIGGSWMIVNRGSLFLTGMAESSIGSASANVTTTTSLTFTVNSVDWGTGSLDTQGGAIECNLTTYGEKSGCVGFNTVSTHMKLENNGDRYLSVALNFSSDAATFIGGTNAAAEYKVIESEVGSCISGDISPEVWTTLDNANTEVCSKFTPIATNNTLEVPLRISIVYDTLPGARSVTATATGTAVSPP